MTGGESELFEKQGANCHAVRYFHTPFPNVENFKGYLVVESRVYLGAVTWTPMPIRANRLLPSMRPEM